MAPARLIPALVLAAAAAGCGGQRSADPPLAHQPLLVPVRKAVRVSDLQPPRIDRWVYINARTGQEVPVVLEPPDRFDAEWVCTEGEGRVQFRRLDEDGNLVATAIIDREDSAVIIFQPPLIIAYDSLDLDERREQTVLMRVLDLDNPKKERERGEARQTITYRSSERVTTPAGGFDTACLAVSFRADLRLADARSETLYYIAPDLGAVAIVEREEVRTLGLFTDPKSRTLLLKEVPAKDAAARR